MWIVKDMAKESESGTTRESLTRERRRIIVGTAAELFAAKGFHQTSIRDIAKRAGISLGNLYNHFSGKEQLIAEIATLEADELPAILALLQRDEDPFQAIERFANGYLDYAAQTENAALAIEIAAEAMRSPAIRDGFSDNRKSVETAIAAILSRGISLGRFDQNLDVTETAALILDLIEALALRSSISVGRVTSQSRMALLSMLKRILSRQFPGS